VHIKEDILFALVRPNSPHQNWQQCTVIYDDGFDDWMYEKTEFVFPDPTRGTRRAIKKVLHIR
jgi:hypothetical protein